MQRSPYHGHRFPPGDYPARGWRYLRFPLNLRDGEEMLAERSLD
jgi:hypothetical protein